MNRTYNQLPEIERGKIEVYLEQGESISEIARVLNPLFQKRLKEVGTMVNTRHVLHKTCV